MNVGGINAVSRAAGNEREGVGNLHGQRPVRINIINSGEVGSGVEQHVKVDVESENRCICCFGLIKYQVGVPEGICAARQLHIIAERVNQWCVKVR